MDRFTDSFILNRTCRCFDIKENMSLKCYQVSLVVDPSLLYLCSKIRCLILFQIAAAASYKKVVKSDGKIAIK